MSFLDSIFNKRTGGSGDGPSRNKNLLNYISNWYLKPTEDGYKKVVFELMEGGAFLLLPSANDNQYNVGWQTADEDSKLKLTSVSVTDGLKVLSVFTDEQALLDWAGQPVNYTEMQSDDVLLLCERNEISRVVINSNSYNMFVLERKRKTVKPDIAGTDTAVRVGTAERQLEKRIIEKIKTAFEDVAAIEEAYQYETEVAGEINLVIGVKLSASTDTAKTGAVFAVTDALKGEAVEEQVKVFFLENFEWLQTVKRIPGAQFYTKVTA